MLSATQIIHGPVGRCRELINHHDLTLVAHIHEICLVVVNGGARRNQVDLISEAV